MKSELCANLLPVLNAGRVELLDHDVNERCIAQICCLERQVTRGGRDNIITRPVCTNDIANAVAGVVVTALQVAVQSVPFIVPFVTGALRRVPGQVLNARRR